MVREILDGFKLAAEILPSSSNSTSIGNTPRVSLFPIAATMISLKMRMQQDFQFRIVRKV